MYQQGCNRTSRHDHNEMVRWAWLSFRIVSNIRKLSHVAICCIWYACRCYFGPFIFAPLFVITWLQNSRFYDFDPHSISARLRVWSIRTIWNRPKSDHRKDWISIIESGSKSSNREYHMHHMPARDYFLCIQYIIYCIWYTLWTKKYTSSIYKWLKFFWTTQKSFWFTNRISLPCYQRISSLKRISEKFRFIRRLKHWMQFI